MVLIVSGKCASHDHWTPTGIHLTRHKL